MSDKTYKILVSEPEQVIRTNIGSMLKNIKKHKIDYILVENGQKAYEELQKQQIDLFLSEYTQPGLNGLELLTLIKKSPSHFHIPVIIITGERDKKKVTQIIESGVDSYILKDLIPANLEDRIYQHIRELENPTKYAQLLNDGKTLLFNVEDYKNKTEQKKVLIEAYKTFEKAKELHPNYADSHYYQGKILEISYFQGLIQSPTPAIKHYVKAMKLKHDIKTIDGLLRIYRHLNTNQETILKLLKLASEVSKYSFHRHYELGIQQAKLGNLENSIISWERAESFTEKDLEKNKQILNQYLKHKLIAQAKNLWHSKFAKGELTYKTGERKTSEEQQREELIFFSQIGNIYFESQAHRQAKEEYELLLGTPQNNFKMEHEIPFNRMISINDLKIIATGIYNLASMYYHEENYTPAMNYLNKIDTHRAIDANKTSEELKEIWIKTQELKDEIQTKKVNQRKMRNEQSIPLIQPEISTLKKLFKKIFNF